MHARVFYLTCTAFQYHARTFYWLTTSRPRHAVFKLLLNAYMIMIFHLSFYFICSTIFNIEMSHFVEFCRILSKAMYIVYNIYSTVYCIQYIFPLYIAYIIISLLKCIQYFFLIHLTRYILYVLRTLFLIY